MMDIDSVTRKRRSDALETGGGGPDGGASGTQHAQTHQTPQLENARREARAREANRLRAFAASASASVSAPPQMPGLAAAHWLDSPPTSTLSFSESPAQAASVTMGIGWVTGRRRSDVLGTGGGGRGGGASGTQHAKTHRTPQWESVRLEARAREAQRLRAFGASASASVSAPPQMPGPPAAAHQLNSPPMSTSSFTVSAAQASALEEFRAACAAARAAYGMQPVQQAPEEARKEDHPRQQQRWGDQFIDVAYADAAAAGFAGMLLDESLHEQQTENEKKYWEGIMHLVNSPLETSMATMPAALEASSSSSAPLQMSVAMPAPEAYSAAAARAASFWTPVAMPPRDA